MDVLTDVIRAMELRSDVQYGMELTAPWGMSAPAMEDGAMFFAVTRGSCFIAVEGLGDPVPLAGGDLVMLPHGSGHTINDRPESPITPIRDLAGECTMHRPLKAFRFGGGGAMTSMIVGRFGMESAIARPFLSGLPPLMHIRGEQGAIAPRLETTLRWIANETASDSPGGQLIQSRLTDILFVQILRSHMAQQMNEHHECSTYVGLLGAFGDRSLAPAFEAIHAEPDRHWTVASLAERAHMSRTAFSTRFGAITGLPPLTYVTQWRMLKAATLLRSGTPITDVAGRVGYESEASFSKAFKRTMGLPPGKYRGSIMR